MATKLKIDGAELCVDEIGQGFTIIVVSGGPGLNHEYMKRSLSSLRDDYRLVFFDQPGCGRSISGKDPTAEQAIEATIGVIDRMVGQSQYGILAHSWGAYLAAAAAERLNNRPLATVLLNPVPLDRSAFNEVGQRLVGRVPADTMTRIQSLTADASPESGREMMEVALPYYSGRNNDLPDVQLEFSIPTSNSIMATLPHFDHWNGLKALGDLHFIFSEDDYINKSDFAGHQTSATLVVVGGGHFSMYDANDAVVRKIRECFVRFK